jgi:DNA-binding FrmR family transcriptional regulator
VIDENGLRESMAGAFDYLRSHQRDLHDLLKQVAALKGALQELSDSKFLPIFERHLAELESQVGQASDYSVARLDEAIRQVKDGERF